MRILTVTHYQLPHWGGIEMTAAALHERYMRLGHEAVWLSSDLPRVSDPPDHHVRVPASNLLADTVGVAYPIWYPRAARTMRKWIDWCDVVNCHDCLYPGTVLALRQARRSVTPFLLTQHAGPWPFYRSAVLRAVQQAAYASLGLFVHRRVDRAVFISRAVQAWFGERVRYRSPTRFVTNGVDTSLFRFADEGSRRAARERLRLPLDRRVILFVGRFLFVKGMPVIEQLARRYPAWLFILVGEGPVNPSRWRLDNVIVRPFQRQPVLRDYYWAGDILVLPSTGEGFPLVVMEAMACGTPAIVSAETFAAWNGGREYFLVSESTSEAVGALLDDPPALLRPEARQSISAYAAANWDWDRVAVEYLEIMAEMVAAGPGGKAR